MEFGYQWNSQLLFSHYVSLSFYASFFFPFFFFSIAFIIHVFTEHHEKMHTKKNNFFAVISNHTRIQVTGMREISLINEKLIFYKIKTSKSVYLWWNEIYAMIKEDYVLFVCCCFGLFWFVCLVLKHWVHSNNISLFGQRSLLN